MKTLTFRVSQKEFNYMCRCGELKMRTKADETLLISLVEQNRIGGVVFWIEDMNGSVITRSRADFEGVVKNSTGVYLKARVMSDQ